jgi:hypothetical protein
MHKLKLTFRSRRLLETAVSTCLYSQRLDPVKAKPAQKTEALALTPAQLATDGIDGGVTAAKRLYTYSTAVEWWMEYTRVPPFQQVDHSRRRVHGYYTFEGCVERFPPPYTLLMYVTRTSSCKSLPGATLEEENILCTEVYWCALAICVVLT